MGDDVIVALATPVGRSALAVVRLTGDAAIAVGQRVCGRMLPARRPVYTRFRDAEGAFDDGLAVAFVGPGTATGQDVVELSCHGQPLIAERLVGACLAAGARIARPGEFTRRAVEAGRMDLIEAEAVDALIRADTAEGVALARAGRNGAISAQLTAFRAEMIGAIAELEARLDWPDDGLTFEDDDALSERLRGIAASADEVADGCEVGRRIVEGVTVALVGAPNVGKSSLFNALAGQARALVHDRPGTTRDAVETRIQLGPLAVRLIDTAGEREADEPVEAAGIALGRRLADEADLRLVVVWAGSPPPPLGPRDLGVANAIDLGGRVADGLVGVSARTGDGVAGLREVIVGRLVGAVSPRSGSLRLASALRSLSAAARGAAEALADAGPAAAASVATDGLTAIDEAGGHGAREAILDAVFSRFCIGK